jgi:hypothetical protein
VLALAAHRDAPGPDLMAALVVAYEVAARFGRAARLRPRMHPHGSWGVAGAAAGCARLLGLDAGATAAAIDAGSGMPIAGHFGSALDGNPVRDAWMAASNVAGLASARLAAAGEARATGTAAGSLGSCSASSTRPSSPRVIEEPTPVLGGLPQHVPLGDGNERLRVRARELGQDGVRRRVRIHRAHDGVKQERSRHVGESRKLLGPSCALGQEDLLAPPPDVFGHLGHVRFLVTGLSKSPAAMYWTSYLPYDNCTAIRSKLLRCKRATGCRRGSTGLPREARRCRSPGSTVGGALRASGT